MKFNIPPHKFLTVISQPADAPVPPKVEREIRYCPYCRKQGNLVPGDVDRGPSRYCYKHYRIQSSRNRALSRNLTTPSSEELERMLPADMKCPLCSADMVYTKSQGDHKSILTLQHWNDGSVSWLCMGCNTAHGMTVFSDEEFKIQMKSIPHDHKMCRDCNAVKPLDAYYVNANGAKGRGAYCKPCHAKRTTR